MRLEAKNITRISYFWPASFFWSLGPGKPPRATAARVRVDQIYGDPNEFVPNFYNFMNPNVLVPHLANTRRTQGEFFERIPEAVHSPKDFQRGDVVLFGGHTSIVAVAGTEATVVLSHLDFDRIEQECYALTKTRTGRSQEDSYVVTRDRLADLRDPTIRALMSTIFVKPYVLYRLRPNRAQMVGWDETELPSRVHRPR